jgi:hypothetical protein
VSTKNVPALIGSASAVFGVFAVAVWLKWDGLVMAVRMDQLAGLLAPVAFAAAVVERGVEILISPWRDAEASKLAKAVAAIKARPIDPATAAKNATDLQAASDALDDYRGTTQQHAFAVSMILSTFVSIAGVRALGPFLDSAKFDALKATDPAQHTFFLCVDVALTATLLAGGADGVHSVVNAVTSFFDASTAGSAEKTAKS